MAPGGHLLPNSEELRRGHALCWCLDKTTGDATQSHKLGAAMHPESISMGVKGGRGRETDTVMASPLGMAGPALKRKGGIKRARCDDFTY